METTLENGRTVTCVRLNMPIEQHGRAHAIKRKLALQKNQDVTVLNIYMQAIELGLQQLEREAA
ncbi:MAG: hypothetical protein WAZ98_03735 [Cyclobacteriaceae bacterium]